MKIFQVLMKNRLRITPNTNTINIVEMMFFDDSFIHRRSLAMKASKLIWFSSFWFCALCTNKFRNESLAPYAISAILSEHPMDVLWDVKVISYGDKSEKSVEKLLRSKKTSTAISIKKYIKKIDENLTLDQPTVLFFDSPEDFQDVLSKNISWQNTNGTRSKHLVHIKNGLLSELEHIQDGFSMDNVGFLVNETEKSIELVTSFMYTQSKCRSNQFVTINKFDKATMEWETDTFYPDKYSNFHGCNLTIGHEIGTEIEDFVKIDSDDYKIYRDLGEILNFEIQTKQFETVLDAMEDEEVDVWIDDSPAEYYMDKHITLSYPIEVYEMMMAVAPGELYTPLERMFLPFQSEVWVAIALTLFFGLCRFRSSTFSHSKSEISFTDEASIHHQSTWRKIFSMVGSSKFRGETSRDSYSCCWPSGA